MVQTNHIQTFQDKSKCSLLKYALPTENEVDDNYQCNVVV